MGQDERRRLMEEANRLRAYYKTLPTDDPNRHSVRTRYEEIQRQLGEQSLAPAATTSPTASPEQAVVSRVPPHSMPAPPSISVNLPVQASGFAIASLIIGIIAAAISWVPFFGCFLIPVALIGMLLAIISSIYILSGKNKGLGFAITGGVLNAIAIVLPILITQGMVSVVNDAAEETRASMEAASKLPTISNPVISVSGDINSQDDFGTTFVFEITNQSNRTLADVQLTMLYMDSQNRRIGDDMIFLTNVTAGQTVVEESRYFGSQNPTRFEARLDRVTIDDGGIFPKNVSSVFRIGSP